MLEIITKFADFYIKSGLAVIITSLILGLMLSWQIAKRMPTKNSRKVSARRRSQKQK